MNFKKIKERLMATKSRRQFTLFMFYGFFSLVAELLVRFLCDIGFRNLDYMVTIPPFREQALGSFLAFLISNLLAKTISFIFNRKKTFEANNSATFSIIIYSVLCIGLLIIETIIGTPIQNRLYMLFGGRFNDPDFSTSSAISQSLYQFCGTLSQLIYCAADAIILFFMNKYVIMKHHDHEASDNQTNLK